MRKIKSRVLGILAVAAVASLFTACKASGSGSGSDIPGGENVTGEVVGWEMYASPHGGDDTAVLDLVFTKAVDGLGTGDFTFLIEGAAITADTLTGGWASQKLSVSNVPETGTVNVSVRKEGFDFSPVSYDWDIATGNTVAVAYDDSTLLSLSVTYTDKIMGNLVGGFTPEDLDYSFSAANGETTATVSVTAASSKASLAISYGDAGGAGQSVANGGSITLPVIGNKTLSVTVTAENSDTRTYTVTIAAYIAQIAPPPVGDGNDDYTLQLLSVTYSGQTENKVAGFVASNTNYSFNVEQGHETATVFAAVSSSLSALDITYGESNADAPQDISVVNDGVITLPAAGSKVLKIKVTAGNGNAQTYYVTINAVAVTKGYSGTIAYSGGSKTILGVVGRDAAFVTQSAGVTGTAWTLTVPDGYIPKSFVVTLSDGTYSYRSKALYPAAISTSSSITLTIDDPDDIGRQVASAQDLAGMSADTNYSLADDIDLNQLGTPWAGPNGYYGKFYGNGYTVSFKFTTITGDIGLFNTLENGALIQDLVVNVIPGETRVPIDTGVIRFGAVVGQLNNDFAYATLSGITVKGKLYIGGGGIVDVGALLIGGLVGEMQRAAMMTIENCVSEIEIDMDLNGASCGHLAIGGLVGYDMHNTTISNSYSSGKITGVIAGNTIMPIHIGGLIGNTYSRGTITVNKSYSSSAIDVNRTFTAAGDAQLYVGGLIGWNEDEAVTNLQNSAALNPSIDITTVAGNMTGVLFGRVAGNPATNFTLQNNYALDSMAVKLNTAPQDVSDGTATDKNGLGKTAGNGTGGLRNSATWTTGLGFDTDVWDFSPLSSGGWPVLR